MAAIFFHNLDRSPALQHKKKLKLHLEVLFKRERRRLHTLSYVFCSDEYLLQMNRDFLAHDYYTDVITFDLGSEKGVTGEVYISIDRVKENSLILGVSFKQELHRVILHGALHLCGYKDKSKVQIAIMRKKEDQYLSMYFNR